MPMRVHIGTAIIILTCFLLALNFLIIICASLQPYVRKKCYWRYLKWRKLQTFK